ncbi:hydantoinase/oxoprolinase family protein [Pararhodobacter zhoushanensis]|uniref:hydantoinase/oxoprolinase family protein n=1 Tax=Pararhodobacter zhoushanensis TaxID=2479545 RepID=UPI000F8DA01F|nr:hydantoinase/oxoprolinase family protein [Pararhodobacter zhoushanensis]
MAILLGVDTGGTYTDAVLLDDTAQAIRAHAKALTSRPDLAQGIGGAIDAVLAQATDLTPADVAMVALSTTLATNALVEGQGARAALVLIGFDGGDRARAGLTEALGEDPLIALAGGHSHAGGEAAPLDLAALEQALSALPKGISAIAVAAQFATRNPAHEIAARTLIRALTGLPVTCSHELSAGLNGPKRALTALLNARLVAMIDRLIASCEGHLARLGITAPLMVVRGDGALVSAALVRERPIETILSGPAASIAGAAWLTGLKDALVSDIGGTTTDVCLLRDGKPSIDPQGARVGGWRTMVEAVAMRTTGLGGDSAVQIREGLEGGLTLGPRRVMPMSLAAAQHPDLVHRMLDEALGRDPSPEETWRLALPLFTTLPAGLSVRDAAVAERLLDGPQRVSALIRTRLEGPALMRLVQAGHVMLAGPTPSDAAHVLGRQSGWDGAAAHKALTLLARRRTGNGERLAADAAAMAQQIVDQLTRQTVECLLEAAFAEDPRDWPLPPETLARHPLTEAALSRAPSLVRLEARLGVPVIGLGASAGCYYGAVGERLGCDMVVPEFAGVANALGAVVGQVSMHAEGQVTVPGPGAFLAHLSDGPARYTTVEAAVEALTGDLTAQSRARAQAAGVPDPRVQTTREDIGAEIEGQPLLVEIRLRVTASGRPRIATG